MNKLLNKISLFCARRTKAYRELQSLTTKTCQKIALIKLEHFLLRIGYTGNGVLDSIYSATTNGACYNDMFTHHKLEPITWEMRSCLKYKAIRGIISPLGSAILFEFDELLKE